MSPGTASKHSSLSCGGGVLEKEDQVKREREAETRTNKNFIDFNIHKYFDYRQWTVCVCI